MLTPRSRALLNASFSALMISSPREKEPAPPPDAPADPAGTGDAKEPPGEPPSTA